MFWKISENDNPDWFENWTMIYVQGNQNRLSRTFVLAL